MSPHQHPAPAKMGWRDGVGLGLGVHVFGSLSLQGVGCELWV